jgi:hypothetical protein
MNSAQRYPPGDALGWYAEEERRRPHSPKPAAPPVARPEPVSDKVPATGAGQPAGDDPRRPRTAVSPAAAPAVSPELIRRFHALVDDVTDELMQGQNLDRRTCRADAIALLIATSGVVDENPPQDGESPLMYLLLEEQQKASLALGRAKTHGPALNFMKA